MTEVLTPVNRVSDSPPLGPGARPLVLRALLAGLVSSLGVLAGCAGIALAGWYASEAGAFGTTRDALRVGADAWLLAHGASLRLGDTVVGLTPWGLTLVCLLVTFRTARRVGRSGGVDGPRSLAAGSGVLVAGYLVVAVVVAVLASTHDVQPDLIRTAVGALLVATLAGGTGLASGAGMVRPWWGQLPETPRAMVVGGLSSALLLVGVASVAVTVGLVWHLGTAATVLSRLHADVAGGLLGTVLVASLAPNAVLLATSYLLGPGFAIGTGTLVSPSAVLLGPVPAFPLLAALPGQPLPSPWATLLLGLPVLVGAVGTGLVVRVLPAAGYEIAAVRGLGAGALAGVLVAALATLAGGAAGPGRMADVGVATAPVLVAAVVSLAIGGLAGSCAMTWWVHRRGSDPQDTAEDDEPTVEISR